MSVIADMGLLSKLRRLKATFSDPRANKSEVINAKRLFEKRCRQAKIDPETVRLDGYVFKGRYVIEHQSKIREMDAKIHTVCQIVGEFWKVEIRATSGHHGLRFDFIGREGPAVNRALTAFGFMVKAVQQQWNAAMRRYEEDTRPRPKSDSIAAMFQYSGSFGMWGRPKPQKKSFISGFYHTITEELRREQRRRQIYKRLSELREEPAAAKPPAEPWLLPPPNPLALMRLPAPTEPVPETAPETNEEKEEKKIPAPAPDPELRADDRLDPTSYSDGQRAARAVDLNRLEL